MYKIINLFFVITIFLFFFNIYKYYSSNKNIKNVNLNRSNIEKIINQLPQSILEIIFFESNIAILWDEKLGFNELKKIHHSINKI